MTEHLPPAISKTWMRAARAERRAASLEARRPALETRRDQLRDQLIEVDGELREIGRMASAEREDAATYREMVGDQCQRKGYTPPSPLAPGDLVDVDETGPFIIAGRELEPTGQWGPDSDPLAGVPGLRDSRAEVAQMTGAHRVPGPGDLHPGGVVPVSQTQAVPLPTRPEEVPPGGPFRGGRE